MSLLTSAHQNNKITCDTPREVTEAASAGNAGVMEEFHHLSFFPRPTDWANVTSRHDVHKKF